MKYRKKPIEIEAELWDGNHYKISQFLEAMGFYGTTGSSGMKKDFLEKNFRWDEFGELIIKTLEGEHIASRGDYIIKGIKGEFYPCKPDIFEMTYEKI